MEYPSVGVQIDGVVALFADGLLAHLFRLAQVAAGGGEQVGVVVEYHQVTGVVTQYLLVHLKALGRLGVEAFHQFESEHQKTQVTRVEFQIFVYRCQCLFGLVPDDVDAVTGDGAPCVIAAYAVQLVLRVQRFFPHLTFHIGLLQLLEQVLVLRIECECSLHHSQCLSLIRLTVSLQEHTCQVPPLVTRVGLVGTAVELQSRLLFVESIVHRTQIVERRAVLRVELFAEGEQHQCIGIAFLFDGLTGSVPVVGELLPLLHAQCVLRHCHRLRLLCLCRNTEYRTQNTDYYVTNNSQISNLKS